MLAFLTKRPRSDLTKVFLSAPGRNRLSAVRAGREYMAALGTPVYTSSSIPEVLSVDSIMLGISVASAPCRIGYVKSSSCQIIH
jgi:hypothetical protein